jgi:hypothetical protein
MKKLKTLFPLMTCLWASLGFGQDHFIMRTGVGHINYFYQSSNIHPYAHIALTSDLDVLFQKSASKHWRFATGLSVARNPFYSIIGNFSSNRINIPTPENTALIRLKSVNYAVSIPLYAHYFFGSKKQFIIGFGIHQQFMNYTSTVATFEGANGNTTQGSMRAVQLNYHVSGQLEVGYNLSLKKSNALQLMVGVRDHTFPISQAKGFYIWQPYFTIGYSLTN